MTSRPLAILLVASFAAHLTAAAGNPGRIDAKYLFSIGPSGSLVELLQPLQIRCDAKQGEFYVCDTGHNRIVILDERGYPTFEFKNSEILQSPTDVAVDSDGRIFVLGAPADGSCIHIFDYNGDYLRPYIVEDTAAVGDFTALSLVIDAADRLYILDGKAGRILCFGTAGHLLGQIPIWPEGESRPSDLMFGSMSLCGDQFLVPLPMVRTVAHIDRNSLVTKFQGFSGGGYGELSFPTAAAQDDQGNTLVLDKHRCVIVSYDRQGQVNGEIGGYGIQPGWFYHPIAMLVDPSQRVWVAQGLNNLVQVLQLPETAPVAPKNPPETMAADD